MSRPSRQVRRRRGESAVIDAIRSTGRVAGEATTVPKSHDGAVEALRMLKLLQRSASKAPVDALDKLHNRVVTAPDDLRSRLRDLDCRGRPSMRRLAHDLTCRSLGVDPV